MATLQHRFERSAQVFTKPLLRGLLFAGAEHFPPFRCQTSARNHVLTLGGERSSVNL